VHSTIQDKVLISIATSRSAFHQTLSVRVCSILHQAPWHSRGIHCDSYYPSNNSRSGGGEWREEEAAHRSVEAMIELVRKNTARRLGDGERQGQLRPKVVGVDRGAARGRPGACGGRSGVDSAGGGPSAWRRSRGEEDSARGAALQTMARHGVAQGCRGTARR
jgi:hypothetical protein